MKELFELFQNKTNDHDLYKQVTSLIEKNEHHARGEENAKFYLDTIKLLNSINNAGCEERRSDQIKTLNDIQERICDGYESFLP